jgi:hypothetical protein
MKKTGRRDLLKGLLLAGSVSQLSALATTAKDHNVEKELVFSVSGLDLKIDTRTGAWTELVDQKTGAVLMKSAPDYLTFTLIVDGKESPFPPLLRPPGDDGLSGATTVSGFKYSSHSVTDEGEDTVLSVNYRQGPWSASLMFRISRGQRRVERRFRVGYDGPGEPYLRQVDIIVPDILVQAGDLIELPAGAFPPSLDPAKVVRCAATTRGRIRWKKSPRSTLTCGNNFPMLRFRPQTSVRLRRRLNPIANGCRW